MDKRYLFAFGMGAASLALGILAVRLMGLGSALPDLLPVQTDPLASSDDLSGPYTHKNLTVYLVHGKNQMSGKTPLTLEEAMDRNLVIVHETSSVNRLDIENVSKTEEVYVQAGDIVKGGKQDRVLAVDLIVPANSGRMPLDAFCVEHGRWTARGAEPTAEFNSSTEIVPSKELKMAAKYSKSQSEVWARVADTQSNLSAASNANVASNTSRSSLQLSLENKEVRANAGEYIEALRSIIEGKDDVIGFVFAINGDLNSGDTYGSSELFAKLWPKTLKAAAIEAVSGSYGSDGPGSINVEDVRDFMAAGEGGRIQEDREITDRIGMITRASKGVLLIESQDGEQVGWLHRNYLKR